jgi:hypothetical protein
MASRKKHAEILGKAGAFHKTGATVFDAPGMKKIHQEHVKKIESVKNDVKELIKAPKGDKKLVNYFGLKAHLTRREEQVQDLENVVGHLENALEKSRKKDSGAYRDINEAKKILEKYEVPELTDADIKDMMDELDHRIKMRKKGVSIGP